MNNQATTQLTTEEKLDIAFDYAVAETAYNGDSHYGCGTSFITLKWGKLVRELKKLNAVTKDSYWGWILEINYPVNGTLEQESFNYAYAKRLNELDETARAFVHTQLN